MATVTLRDEEQPEMLPRTKLLVTAAFLTCIGGAVTPLRAATYYVTKGGNDSNPCSQSQPCLTISRGRAVATRAGDVVQVGAGTYSERVTLSSSGSLGSPITFRGHDGGGCPTTPVSDVNHPTGVRPNSAVTVVGGFSISGSYVTLDCFRVQSANNGDPVSTSAGTQGVAITNNEIYGSGGTSTPGKGIVVGYAALGNMTEPSYARNYTIQRNYIHGTSGGMLLVCSNCLIEDNEIASLGGNTGEDLDYLREWGINTVIRHNYMHSNTINACNGADCHMDCIQAWNTTGNGTQVSKKITFDRNICFNHHEGVIVQDNAGSGDIGDWTVTNNVFAFPPWDDGSGHRGVAGAVHPWCWIFENGKLGTGTVFANNTCVNGMVGFRGATGSATFKNNIYYRTDSGAIYQNGGGTSVSGSNNLQYSQGNSMGATFSSDIANQNPQFVSMGTDSQRCVGCNFRLQSSSPAIDRGTNTGVGVDLTGAARPQGASYDIGAYEYGAGGGTPPPTQTLLPPASVTAVVK